MCGFVGIFGAQSESFDLASSINLLRHRGPDDSSFSSGKYWSIGFSRLAILDLSKNGMQPFQNASCAVFYNGEIYNFKELQKRFNKEFSPQSSSDGEILPFLFSEYGIKFLDMINGMFSMIVIDKQNNEVFLIRDRFAKKPFFYKHFGENTIFGSEIKALQQIVPCNPSSKSALMSLYFWGLPPPFSCYEDVYSVLPGHYIKLSALKRPENIRWYNPLQKNQSDKKFSHDYFESLFKDSLQLRYQADVPVGVLLSGGIDSMLITDTLRRSGKKVTALTCNIPNKEKWESSTDTENPKKYCSQFNLERICTTVDYDFWNKKICSIITNFDEPLLDSGNLIFYALGELANKHNIRVVLVGNGGDELFGGYPWQSRILNRPLFFGHTTQSKINLLKIAEKCIEKAPRLRISRPALKIFRYLLFPEYFQMDISSTFSFDILHNSQSAAESIRAFANKLNKDILGNSFSDWGNHVNNINLQFLVPQQNYKVDMGSMAFSVENRCPFLDYRIVEYMMSIPHALKVQRGPKTLIKKYAEAYLPKYVLQSRKSGPTMPLPFWFYGDKMKIAKMFLLKSKNLFGDFFGGKFADYWLYGDQKLEKPCNALTLFALLSLALWIRRTSSTKNWNPELSFEDLSCSIKI